MFCRESLLVICCWSWNLWNLIIGSSLNAIEVDWRTSPLLSRYLYCKSDPQCLLWDSVQHRFNLTKTVRKFPIDSHLQRIGQEVHSGPVPNIKSHGDPHGEEDIPYEHLGEGAVELNQKTFDTYTHLYDLFPPQPSWCAPLLKLSIVLVPFLHIRFEFSGCLILSVKYCVGFLFWWLTFMLHGVLGVPAWWVLPHLLCPSPSFLMGVIDCLIVGNQRLIHWLFVSPQKPSWERAAQIMAER